jgi:hypothetical protein
MLPQTSESAQDPTPAAKLHAALKSELLETIVHAQAALDKLDSTLGVEPSATIEIRREIGIVVKGIVSSSTRIPSRWRSLNFVLNGGTPLV